MFMHYGKRQSSKQENYMAQYIYIIYVLSSYFASYMFTLHIKIGLNYSLIGGRGVNVM